MHEFYPTVTDFLSQAGKSILKRAGYRQEYKSFGVRLSFGQGAPAHVPWMAFLTKSIKSMRIPSGIYPILLFYKSKKLVILSIGIGESINRDFNFRKFDMLTVDEFFREKGLGKPQRYGTSLVYKVYDIDMLDERICDDLDQLLIKYHKEIALY